MIQGVGMDRYCLNRLARTFNIQPWAQPQANPRCN